MTLLTTISKIGLYLEIILHPILKVRCIFVKMCLFENENEKGCWRTNVCIDWKHPILSESRTQAPYKGYPLSVFTLSKLFSFTKAKWFIG